MSEPETRAGSTSTLGLRVVVFARQPIARAGLRGLLVELSDVVVVGQATSVEQATGIVTDLQPDVVLASWEAAGIEEALALAEAAGMLGIPLVLLGDAPGPPELSALLRAGLRGFLLSDVSATDVGAALGCVARGFLVLDPLLGRALPPAATTPFLDEGASFEPLTDREQEVLQLLALGLPNKVIARRLNVTEHTVKFHVGSILAKLGVGSRTEAVTRAARRGLVTL